MAKFDAGLCAGMTAVVVAYGRVLRGELVSLRGSTADVRVTVGGRQRLLERVRLGPYGAAGRHVSSIRGRRTVVRFKGSRHEARVTSDRGALTVWVAPYGDLPAIVRAAELGLDRPPTDPSGRA